MANMGTTTHIKGIKLNLLNRTTHKKQTKAKELLQRLEALRSKVSTLRQQCEEIKTIMNNKTQETIPCSKCGQQIKHNEAALFKTDNEEKAYCKTCFAEMWK
jgi:predicted RNase H-like nuclease (RuvC/YqgF family)